jgi:hypothetical protein
MVVNSPLLARRSRTSSHASCYPDRSPTMKYGCAGCTPSLDAFTMMRGDGTIGVDGWFRTPHWMNGHRALDFCVLQFSIESLQKLTPTVMVTAWLPDVLMISGASFHSAVMCRKRLPIGVGERWSVEGATSYLRQKGHFSAKSAKGHFTCRTRIDLRDEYTQQFS